MGAHVYVYACSALGFLTLHSGLNANLFPSESSQPQEQEVPFGSRLASYYFLLPVRMQPGATILLGLLMDTSLCPTLADPGNDRIYVLL